MRPFGAVLLAVFAMMVTACGGAASEYRGKLRELGLPFMTFTCAQAEGDPSLHTMFIPSWKGWGKFLLFVFLDVILERIHRNDNICDCERGSELALVRGSCCTWANSNWMTTMMTEVAAVQPT